MSFVLLDLTKAFDAIVHLSKSPFFIVGGLDFVKQMIDMSVYHQFCSL